MHPHQALQAKVQRAKETRLIYRKRELVLGVLSPA
jgi:hypothetical protein